MSRRWWRRSIASHVALPVLLASCSVAESVEAFEHGHDVGLGYQSGHIWAKQNGSFHLRSLAMSYLTRLGGDFAAEVRLSLLFPLRARQAELSFSPSAEYDKAQQYDAFVGPNFRWFERPGQRVDSALGPHFHYVRFRSTEFVEWSSAAMGLGASTTGRWVIGPHFAGGRGELGLRGELSYDFLDLSRGGDMIGGFHAGVLLLLGWATETKR